MGIETGKIPKAETIGALPCRPRLYPSKDVQLTDTLETHRDSQPEAVCSVRVAGDCATTANQ